MDAILQDSDGGDDTEQIPNVLMDLLEESEIVNWDGVIDRLSTHPHEASIGCRGLGYSALHKALWKRAPYSVIRAIVDAHPQAVFDRSDKGATPLHLAVIFAEKDVVKLLIEANPEAASHQTNKGTIPLHGAKDHTIALMLIRVHPRGVCIRGGDRNLPLHAAAGSPTTSAKVVKLLIEEGLKWKLGGASGGGGVFMKNFRGHTPLSLVCRDIETRYRMEQPSLNNEAADFKTQWDKLVEVVRVAYTCSNFEPNAAACPLTTSFADCSFRLLHATIDLVCPPVVISHALDMYGNQIRESDRMGRFPLHIAALREKTSSKTIKMLLEHAHDGIPNSAAIPDRNGRLPLNLAIIAGRKCDSGLKAIFKASPTVLEQRDVKTGLYPFMLAAACDDDQADLTTVYRLLRESPYLVKPSCGVGD